MPDEAWGRWRARGSRWSLEVEEGGGDDRDEARAEADREVDAPGDDDEDHAAGHDGDDGHLGEDVLDVVGGPVGRLGDAEAEPDDYQGDDQDVGPDVLPEQANEGIEHCVRPLCDFYARRTGHDFFLGRFRDVQRAVGAALPHDHHPVAHAEDFLELGGDHDDANTRSPRAGS